MKPFRRTTGGVAVLDRADVDEIIDEHLRHGRIVERLRM